MTRHISRDRLGADRAEIIADWLNEREDELLDGVITAAALVAGADGRIEPVERGQMLDFLRRNGLFSAFTRAEILDAFERRIRGIESEGGTEMAVGNLLRLAGRSPARLVIDASREIAVADCRLDPREARMLGLIRAALLAGGPRPALAAARIVSAE